MRCIRSTAIACLVAAFFLSAAPAGAVTLFNTAPDGSRCRGNYFVLETLHVEAEATKKKFPRGSAAIIKVTVTRPGHHDPLGLGLEFEPPASTPVEDARVDAAFSLGRYYLFGIAETDANGKATVRIPLPKDVPSGWADVSVAAHVFYNRGGCPDGEEFGANYFERMFLVL